MNREVFVQDITYLLSVLKTEIKESGKLNLLNINVHAEDFFRDLLNLVYDWQLQNRNQLNQNAAGIDLWYEDGKMLIQVSSTSTKTKIQSSLDKLNDGQYAGYGFKFLRIDGDVRGLRKEVYTLPMGITFAPKCDIMDISSLLNDINHLDIDKLKAVDTLCNNEIVPPSAPKITETDLSVVVKALASDTKDWAKHRMPIVFDIDRKISFNHLERRKRIIDDYKLYIGKLNAVYQEFLNNGSDPSFIILQNLSDMYSRKIGKNGNDEVFDQIVEESRNLAMNSGWADVIALDRLNVCIYVIVVDAFVRCRIFEDPEGYNNVDA